MNSFQNCKNSSDAVPFYLPQQLYLKPIARMNISLQLPQKTMGKSISNWEVMERLRSMIRPEEFIILKVTKTTIEFIRFEAEIDSKDKLEKVIAKLDNKMVKLKDFPELMRLRACETKLNFPSRYDWDTFYREAKDMNEMKPGERPDTVYMSNLPIKWFVPRHLADESDLKPSEKIFYRIFEKFGHIRRVDVPICDPYRKRMKREVSGMQMFSFEEEHFFEGYVQFKDYIGFTKAMDALRGMKLMHKTDRENYTINIDVDFDKSKHLSDGSVRRREIVRDRLVRKEMEREENSRKEHEEEERKKEAERQKEIDEKNEKERRRQQREEKRKTKLLAKLKIKGADELNEKIAREEKKLLKVQRKLEAIRLVEELFRRIKNKHEKNSLRLTQSSDDNELTRMKNSSELEVHQQKQKLHKVIEGRVVLKSILAGGPHCRAYEDSSSSDESSKAKKDKQNKNSTDATGGNSANAIADYNFPPVDPHLNLTEWYGYPPNGIYTPYQIPTMYNPLRGYPGYYPYPRGKNMMRGIPGSSRGGPPYGRHPRGPRYKRGYRNGKFFMYPPDLQKQYCKYFEKFLHEHDDRNRSSYSRSRSRSKSPSHRRTSTRRSRSRSYRKSKSRSRSRSRYRSRNRYRSKSRSRRSSSRSRSRSYSRKRSRSRSRRSSLKRNRNGSHSPRTPAEKRSDRHERKSRSRSVGAKSTKDRDKSRSPSYRSIDTSKFISPSRLRMPRSKSWSLPREQDNSDGKKRSWSRSPSLTKSH